MDLSTFPVRMLRNFIERFEAGGVQSTPRLRFVDGEGRACIAAAFCGVRASGDLAPTAAGLGHGFRGGILEELSRRFEAGALKPSAVYDACLLEVVRRKASLPGAGPNRRAGARPSPSPSGKTVLI